MKDGTVQSKEKTREISRKLGLFSTSPKQKSLWEQVTLCWQMPTAKMAFPAVSMTICICEVILKISIIYIYIYLYTDFKKPKLIITWKLNNVFWGLTNGQGMSRLLNRREPGSKFKHLIPSHPPLTITSLPQTAPMNSLKDKSWACFQTLFTSGTPERSMGNPALNLFTFFLTGFKQTYILGYLIHNFSFIK